MRVPFNLKRYFLKSRETIVSTPRRSGDQESLSHFAVFLSGQSSVDKSRDSDEGPTLAVATVSIGRFKETRETAESFAGAIHDASSPVQMGASTFPFCHKSCCILHWRSRNYLWSWGIEGGGDTYRRWLLSLRPAEKREDRFRFRLGNSIAETSSRVKQEGGATSKFTWRFTRFHSGHPSVY